MSGWSEKELRATGAPRPDAERVKPSRPRRSSSIADAESKSAEVSA